MTIPRHIIIKLLKNSDKQPDKNEQYIHKTKTLMTVNFSEVAQEARKDFGVKSLKYWKKKIVNLEFYAQLNIFQKERWNKVFFSKKEYLCCIIIVDLSKYYNYSIKNSHTPHPVSLIINILHYCDALVRTNKLILIYY